MTVCLPGNPLGRVVRGILSGAAGTVAMDLLWFSRYKRGGGDDRLLHWEFSVGLDDWSNAPAPAQIGKRLFEALLQRELQPRWVPLTNNVMHWAYGIGWAGLYGLVAGSLCPPTLRSGLAFGAVVWSSDYVILPLAKVYKPIWEYEVSALWADLSAHLVYGVATAFVFKSRANISRLL